MKKVLLIPVFVIILLQHGIYAGPGLTERDSLRIIAFDKSLPDTTRLQAGIRLCNSFFSEMPDSMFYYSRFFYDESVKTDYTYGMVIFTVNKGWYHSLTGNPDEALKSFLAAMELAEKTSDPELLAYVYNSVSQGYSGFRMYDKMGEYLLRALKIVRESGNLEDEISILGNLAFVYYHTGDRKKAIDTYLRVIILTDSCKISYGDAKPNAFYRLGGLYVDEGKNLEAIRCYFEAQKLNRQNNNLIFYHHTLYKMAYFFLDDTLNLYGKEIGDDRKSVDIALAYSEELAPYFSSMQDSMILSECYLLDAKAYMLKGEKRKALERLRQAEKVQCHDSHIEHNIFFKESLAQIYEDIGEYKTAMSYYKEVILLQDSAKEVEMADKVSQLTESYEIEQMEDQLSRKDEQLAKNRVITRLFIAVSALILILAAVVYYFLRLKQKQNREIEKARFRAEQGEKFKERFLASMSHEIRTPLNAVIGMTGLLLDDPQPPKTEHFLRNIKQAGEHLTGIINEILDLSKIDAGKLELYEAPFSMQEMMEEIGNLLSAKAKEKGLQLIIHKEEGTPCWFDGDAGRIRQILLNLADNAIKFTEQGSVQIKIMAVEAGENKAEVSFSVEDTGTGIPVELQAVIFEEFVQAGKSEDTRIVGTGLGLSIARKLVKRMGGKLLLESEPGKGSVFSFTILLDLSSKEAYQALLREKDLSVMALKGSFRILVAEDNPSNQIVTQGLLEKILPDSSIILVEDGFKALALLEKEKFDLVLMDIRMPGIDGYETTRRLRAADHENADIPVIALTASVIRTDIQHCLDAGMNGYVPKPVSISSLAKTIQEHLKKESDKEAMIKDPEDENFLAAFSDRPAWSDRLYASCNGKKERFIQYLEIFQAQSEEEVSRWHDWIEHQQHEPLAHSVHKLLPHIRSLMDEKSAAQASLLDQELRKGWSDIHLETLKSLKMEILQLHHEANELRKVIA